MTKAPAWTKDEQKVLNQIQSWYNDPVTFVKQMFGIVPDDWQIDYLNHIALGPEPRTGASACKGPGKTCAEAWAIWWFVYTRPDAQVICTSITADNLRDNLWKELSLWYSKAPALQHAFEIRGERIVSRTRPKTWFCAARSWPQDADQTRQADALAGFHGKHVMFVLDEMGSYPLGVLMAAEAIFSNKDVDEAKLIAAWNPTSTQHAAYHVCTRDRGRWNIINISGDPEDPKRSPRISKDWAQGLIDLFGRDNDYVRVNVLGLFPLVGEDKLLGPDQVAAAQKRDVPLRALDGEASVWGLDVARFGGDRSVLRERCGPVAMRPHVWRQLDGPSLAQRVVNVLEHAKRSPDYLFIDVTGGAGASPYDHLVLMGWGHIAIPVEFGGSADDPKFCDKRTEMYWRMAHWLKKYGCLPKDSSELAQELTEPSFGYRTRAKLTRLALETKEELRRRGVASPDEADALALTFYQERTPKREFLKSMNEIAHREGGLIHTPTWAEKMRS
jgi:hypothetical protein